jgi:hypothetical protein
MKTTKRLITGVLAAGMLGAVGFSQVAYGADLVVNGSFEATAQASGTWSVYSNLAGVWIGLPNIELRNNVAGTAYDGVNFVELDTHDFIDTNQNTNITNSAMKQTLTGAAGLYQLSFWYSARPNTGSTNDLRFTFDGSSAVTLLSGVSNNTSNHIWTNYTALFNFDGSGDLTFYASGLDDSYGGSLDKVSFTTAPVPEPETYAMMLAGLGLMGLVARRRKQKLSS